MHLSNKASILLFSLLILMLAGCEQDSISYSPSGTGIAGSTARFAISGDHLYVIDRQNLKTYDISNNADPNFTNETEVGPGIETIFPYEEKLYLGARNGMYIYDLSNPAQPSTESSSFFSHFTGCDPVVVQDDIAYVTVRASGSCQTGFVAESLIMVDVSDSSNPLTIQETQVENPYGLGIDGNTLFLCQGDLGFSIWNVEDPDNPQMLQQLEDLHSIDVIPRNGLLMIIGQDGLYQYQYLDGQEPQYLSHIPVTG